jgi:rhodanese-related sulfurtransferase
MNQTIKVQDLQRIVQNHEPVQLVDVRSPGEYAAGHVPQAINIPLEQLEARFEDLKEGQVAVLCQSGKRAGMACEMLRQHHDGLLLVEGGTQAWIDAGLPIVSSVSNRWSLERQVRLGAGVMVLVGTILAALGYSAWLYLAMFVGAGLTFAGLTNVCGMALLLAKLPWNRPAAQPARFNSEARQS